MRQLSDVEAAAATELVNKAILAQSDPTQRWEWLCGIDEASLTQLDFRTDHRNSSVDLGPIIDGHIAGGGKVIIHHNHVGLNSLSGGDWFGMAQKPELVENWVHLYDGTWYRGGIKPEGLY